jgi:hypothetical protein
MDKRTSSVNFLAKQLEFAQEVKSLNEALFNALNVELERTDSTVFIPHWEVIAASMPGVMKEGSHRGYAETENLNDKPELFSLIVDSACFVIADKKGWVYPDFLFNNKYEIQQAKERNKENNLTGCGRRLARFNYLLQNSIKAIKEYETEA